MAEIVMVESVSEPESISSIDLTINRSWDDDPRDYKVDIKLSRENGFVIMEVNAPFFHDTDPGGEPGEPRPELWQYEVVEAFFLGSDNMYLEVELAPRGQHLLLFLAGPKHPIKAELPLKYTAKIEYHKWYGKAEIPVEYFPPNVSMFNAYAIHGEDEDREYDALYPAPSGCFEDPDFHRLHLFKPIDFKNLVKRDRQLSEAWKNALDEAKIEYDENVLNAPEKTMEFRIGTNWEEEILNHSGVFIKLRVETDFVVLEIFSPFHNGRRPKQRRLQKLWEYEVVHAMFVGTGAMYLDLICSPYGQYLVVLMATPEYPIKMSLTLNYTAKIDFKNRYWTGKAEIPIKYFPPLCNLFNVHAVHGPKYSRKYESLFPALRGRYANPKLHEFHYFKEINFEKLFKRKVEFSKLWRSSLTKAGVKYFKKNFFLPKAKIFDRGPGPNPLPEEQYTLVDGIIPPFPPKEESAKRGIFDDYFYVDDSYDLLLTPKKQTKKQTANDCIIDRCESFNKSASPPPLFQYLCNSSRYDSDFFEKQGPILIPNPAEQNAEDCINKHCNSLDKDSSVRDIPLEVLALYSKINHRDSLDLDPILLPTPQVQIANDCINDH